MSMQSNLIIKNTVKQKPQMQNKKKYPSEYGSDVFRRGLNILTSFYNFKLLTQFGFGQNIKSNM